MIKKFLPLVMLCAAFQYCSTPAKTTRHQNHETEEVRDTYTPKADIKSYAKVLAGHWNVVSMRRQQKAAAEPLSGVFLDFDPANSKFTGRASCNRIFGTIALNGYGIRFSNIGSTRMSCDRLDQETAMVNLLQERISAFTVDGNKLYLRDGISNIVFECVR